MAAIGELIVLGIYIVLFALTLILSLTLIYKSLKREKVGWLFVGVIIVGLSLILFARNQDLNHKKAALKYVGTYHLNNYPKCQKCQLKLLTDNRYEVLKDSVLVESGEWKYRSGGDFWIVDIGEHGQLGTGNFKYDRKEK